VKRIYPSTVYPEQDICFNVFTDASNSGSKKVYTEGKIGDEVIDWEAFDDEDNNWARISNWNNYELCATAGVGPSKESNPLNLMAEVGKYMVSEYAYTYHGASKYAIRTVPKISSVNTNQLYNAEGAIITIKGLGFDPDTNNNMVDIDDLS
jgi:hypothetical protein